jgi:hypothetical protein
MDHNDGKRQYENYIPANPSAEEREKKQRHERECGGNKNINIGYGCMLQTVYERNQKNVYKRRSTIP